MNIVRRIDFAPTVSPAVVSTAGTISGVTPAGAVGPWTGTITGMTTAGLTKGSIFTATAGAGSLGAGGYVRVVEIGEDSTSLIFTKVGGTRPVNGAITNISTSENDVAVFQNPRANYTITQNATLGFVTVSNVGNNGGGAGVDGVDILTNIETLEFADQVISVSALAPSATQLSVLTAPGGATPTAALAQQPVIQVLTATNLLAATSTAPVTVALVAPAAGVSLAGTLTVNAINGIATFTNLSVRGTVGQTATLRFTSAGLTSPVDQTVTINAVAGAGTLSLVTRAAPGVSGNGVLATQPVVQLAGGSAATVTISINGGAAFAPTSVLTSNFSGVGPITAAFSGLSITTVPRTGLYTLTYTTDTAVVVTQQISLATTVVTPGTPGGTPGTPGSAGVIQSVVPGLAGSGSVTVTWTPTFGAATYSVQAYAPGGTLPASRTPCTVTVGASVPATYTCVLSGLSATATGTTFAIGIVASNGAASVTYGRVNVLLR